MEKFTTRLAIGVMALMVVLSITNQAKANWYKTASKDHKKWAKEYHNGVSTYDRYLSLHEMIIGHEIDMKSQKYNFPGIKMKVSMNGHKNGYNVIKGAEEFAYNGKHFHSFTTDWSKCRVKEGFSDCAQGKGSTRTELLGDPHKYTFTEGTEKWINYAMKPGKDILWPENRSRTFTVGQCHPWKSHRINWMIKFRKADLVLTHNYKSFKHKDGTYVKGYLDGGDRILKSFYKKDINEHNGLDNWINIRINFKNSKNPDGKLHIWLDGELVYEYNGPTNWRNYKGTEGAGKDNCTFKFGLYVNGNGTAVDKTTTEGNIMFVDYAAFASTEEKLEKLLAKDK